MRTPLPWQPPILDYLRKHPLAFLGVEMRLGKSYCAGQWAKYHNAKQCLITAPISAIPDWVRGLEEGDGEICWDLTQPQNFREWTKYEGKLPGRFFITNHHSLFLGKGRKIKCPECLPREPKLTCKICEGKGTYTRSEPAPTPIAIYDWDAVIFDELTALKNPQSQINMVAKYCLGNIPLRCGLSGEYAPEGPLDIFEQMRWVFGDFMGRTNYWKWRNENFEESGYEWVPQRGKRSEIRNAVAQRGYLLRKVDVGMVNHTERISRYCDLSQKIKKVYDHAEAFFEIPAGVAADGEARPTRFTSYVVAVRNWLCQLAGGYIKGMEDLHSDHKVKLLWEIIQEFRGEPLVVSFRHNAEIVAVRDFLQKKGIETLVLWGGQSTVERKNICQKFRDRLVDVVLKQCKVHFGLDLSTADTMVRFSLPDRYEDLSQDRERIVHPLKQRPLLYIDLVARDTVDEDLVLAAPMKTIDARYYMQRLEHSFFQRSNRKLEALKQ